MCSSDLDQLEIRIGDAAADVFGRLGNVSDLTTPSVERGPTGERQTRTLDVAGRRVVLVIERFESDAEPRVAAIYLP